MKRLLSIAAAAVLFFAAAPVKTAFAEDKTEFSAMHYRIENGEVCFSGSIGDKISELVIPDTYKGLPVTSIADDAFQGNESIVSCVIPDTVKSIGDLAFAACPNLKSVSIGSGLSSFGRAAFANCTKLTSVTVSKDNPDFSAVNSCLYSKKGDTLILYAGGSNAVIPDKTKTIGKWAFFERDDITSVSIPNSVTAIEDSAFSGCLSLKAIDIPDSVKSLGNNCFMSCHSLSKVRLSKSLTAVPQNCFYSCTDLNYIVIPDNITSIGKEAFFSCFALSGIYIPKTVTSIDKDAVGIKYDSWRSSAENIPSFVIKGEKGSAAEKYASENDIIFSTAVLQKGDVTMDGVIDAVDASTVLSEYAMVSTDRPSTLVLEQVIAADYDNNTSVNAVDASLILAKYAENAVKH